MILYVHNFLLHLSLLKVWSVIFLLQLDPCNLTQIITFPISVKIIRLILNFVKI